MSQPGERVLVVTSAADIEKNGYPNRPGPRWCTCTYEGPERWLYEARDGQTRCSDCERVAMPKTWEGDDS